MAYGTLAAVADATKAFAQDLISGAYFTRIKIAFGVEGTATDVSASNPLPVTGTVALDAPSLAALETIAVTGTVALDAPTLAALENTTVIGPLTNAELRAAAVPVSGTFFQATQPVSIAASVAVTGPLTDTQLRAAAVPVSAASLPLPAGAATSAAQTTGNNSLASVDGKLPGSLGAKAGAASLSVVPSTDTPFDTIATTYAKVIASNVIARPANTTPYSAGQIVGVAGGGTSGRFAFAGMARINGGAVRIDRMRLYKSQANALGSFQLWIYRGDPAAAGAADQAAAVSNLPVGGAAAAIRLIGRISFDMTGAAVGTDGAEVSGIPITGPALLAAAGAAETALYGVLVATGAYTPASGETFSVIAEGYSF